MRPAVPADRRYHPDHTWVLVDGDFVTVGITWHAQQTLGDVVDFAPPAPGDELRAGVPCCELESLKAVSDVVAPIAGEVTEVNLFVVSSPEAVNDDPYAAWLFRLRIGSESKLDELLEAPAYEALLS